MDSAGEIRLTATPEFDRIADVYDETRRGLDEETVNGIKEMLTRHGCRSILEIGVGTGRVAVPLIRSGYEITGMDISSRMMEKAREKGVMSLFLAEGSKAPFRKDSFDATLMAHVFHLLDNPLSVMREAARVSSVGVFALVRKRNEARPWSFFSGDEVLATIQQDGSEDNARKYFEERRERFRKISQKYGWNPSNALLRWRREGEILETYPPDDLRLVSDVVVNESLEERISRFEKGRYSFMSRMPDEMRREIINEMRSPWLTFPQGAAIQTRHEVYQLAMWNSNRLLAL